MEFQYLLIKFVRHFVTSLIIHISKKLVYFLDDFLSFNLSDSAQEQIQCSNCNNTFRFEILHKIDSLDTCPCCYTQLNITKREIEEYERRRSSYRPGYSNN